MSRPSRPTRLRRLASGWGQAPVRRGRLLVAEAAFWMIVARLAITLLPFRWLVPWVGHPQAVARAGDDPAVSAASNRLADDVAFAVRRAVTWLPLAMVCLPQAMATQRMLERRGVRVTFHLGAAKIGGGLLGHAWVSVGGRVVIGGENAAEHAELARFRHP